MGEGAPGLAIVLAASGGQPHDLPPIIDHIKQSLFFSNDLSVRITHGHPCQVTLHIVVKAIAGQGPIDHDVLCA